MTREHTTRRRTPGARKRRPGLLALAILALTLPFSAARADVQEGLASWYGDQFHGRATASGEPFDAAAMTMAHPSLPFGTKVRVTNLRNGRSVEVRVNDRGPFVGSRIADLSHAAAVSLGMMKRGIARVRIEVLGGH